jgi:predicted adenylyl cyclase CyaB
VLEVETKYFLGDEAAARALTARWGIAWADGTFEVNRIFDFKDRRLARAGSLVRVRTRDDGASLTFKKKVGGGDDRLKVREEHDSRISAPDSVLCLLGALGLEEVLRYERYRATHPLAGTVIEIDRLPGGWFCEIEGDAGLIARRAAEGGLGEAVPIACSYPEIFRRLAADLGFEARAWTFDFATKRALSLPPPGDSWWSFAREAP